VIVLKSIRILDSTLRDGSQAEGISLSVEDGPCLTGNTAPPARLRTADLSHPWQSYRQKFEARPEWHVVELLFKDFKPHRTDVALDVGRLKRIGVVAIGRPFEADISIGGVRFLDRFEYPPEVIAIQPVTNV